MASLSLSTSRPRTVKPKRHRRRSLDEGCGREAAEALKAVPPLARRVLTTGATAKGDERAAATDALADVLRAVVAELVATEVERQLADRDGDEPAPFLTVAEAAGYLRISEGLMRQKIRRHSIPSYKVEGRRLLRRQDLDEAVLGSPAKVLARAQLAGFGA
jgi:excisionase family DNA binding protein